MGWWWPAAGLGELSTAVRARDLLKEATIIFISSTIVCPQVKYQGGNKPHPSIDNCIKDLLSMALPQQNKTQFPPQSDFPIRKHP